MQMQILSVAVAGADRGFKTGVGSTDDPQIPDPYRKIR